jgi:hypothetical protein
VGNDAASLDTGAICTTRSALCASGPTLGAASARHAWRGPTRARAREARSVGSWWPDLARARPDPAYGVGERGSSLAAALGGARHSLLGRARRERRRLELLLGPACGGLSRPRPDDAGWWLCASAAGGARAGPTWARAASSQAAAAACWPGVRATCWRRGRGNEAEGARRGSHGRSALDRSGRRRTRAAARNIPGGGGYVTGRLGFGKP